VLRSSQFVNGIEPLQAVRYDISEELRNVGCAPAFPDMVRRQTVALSTFSKLPGCLNLAVGLQAVTGSLRPIVPLESFAAVLVCGQPSVTFRRWRTHLKTEVTWKIF
jgi:hypothetical protein